MRPAMVEKQKIIDQIHLQILQAKTTIIVQYQGLTVRNIASLRKQLKSAGAELKIYKNNLFARALSNSDYKDLRTKLIGPNAFIFGFEGDLEIAKILADFAKKNKLLKLKAAIIDKKIINETELITIASLPPKDTLISMFLYCVQAPVRNFALTLKAIAVTKEQKTN